MNNITTIAFDLGGVIITLDQKQALQRFGQLGLGETVQHLDPYRQNGIFGDIESGDISEQQFVETLSQMAGRKITHKQCCHAWQGYVKELPQRNLRCLRELRSKGYRLVLLSNTNPFIMEWALSTRFDGNGHSIEHYFDHLYLSYQMGMLKPDPGIFRQMLIEEQTMPDRILYVDDSPKNVSVASQMNMFTMCPENGADWTQEIFKHLI